MIPIKTDDGLEGNVLGRLNTNIISYLGILLIFSFIKIKVRETVRYTTIMTGIEAF